MRISELWGRHPGQDVYLVGTGPSLRVFPLSWLADKITIGINQAYRHEPLPGQSWTYHLSCHPELVEEAVRLAPHTKGHWLVKRKRPLSFLPLEHPDYYFFQAGTKTQDPQKLLRIECLKTPSESLWLGAGSHCSAMNAARHMGARAIILVGVDMGQLGADHHAHEQPILSRGHSMDQVYYNYRYAAREVRQHLRKLGTPILSLTPFLGAAAANEDYRHLLAELELTSLPPPPDNTREHVQRKHTGRVPAGSPEQVKKGPPRTLRPAGTPGGPPLPGPSLPEPSALPTPPAEKPPGRKKPRRPSPGKRSGPYGPGPEKD